MNEETMKILNRAKTAVKGSYSVYESFKRDLLWTCETSIELEEACKELARILRV